MRGHGGCENLETGKSTNECSRVALSPIQSECSVRLKPIHVNGGRFGSYSKFTQGSTCISTQSSL